MRLIDADWVLAALGVFNDRKHGDAHFFNGIASAEEIVEHAPTIATRDWTPCAEGMPDTNDDVYITYEYRGKRIAAVGFMGHSGAWYILSNDDGNEARVNAVAWQPLPSPYRADDTTGKVKEEAE